MKKKVERKKRMRMMVELVRKRMMKMV